MTDHDSDKDSKKGCPYPDDLKAKFEDVARELGYACATCKDRDCIHNVSGH